MINSKLLVIPQKYKDSDVEVVRKDGILLLREMAAEVKNFMDFKMNAVMVSKERFNIKAATLQLCPIPRIRNFECSNYMQQFNNISRFCCCKMKASCVEGGREMQCECGGDKRVKFSGGGWMGRDVKAGSNALYVLLFQLHAVCVLMAPSSFTLSSVVCCPFRLQIPQFII